MLHQIKSKTKMYRYLKAGRLGNTAKTYNTVADIPDDAVVGVRYSKIGSMSRCIYGINKTDLVRVDLTDAVISEYPQANADVVMNAEVMEIPKGMHLRYKLGNMVMRDAMKAPDTAEGLRALMILLYYMDPTSRDTLTVLLDTYRDHVIEFTIFDRPVGMLGLPTIFWEVRKY